MANYSEPLFTIDDLEEELPWIEVWGHRINMRDPRSFSLADNNTVVNFNQSLGDLDKLGKMNPRKVGELEEVADKFINFVCPDFPGEVANDPRYSFMVKLRIIRAYNELFTSAMAFEDENPEASQMEMEAR